ncbi:hypothetical protein E4U55_003217 [Claviceps digitariae]|nr:hypothetical protein E4U55_003217 [Claviceps digitariae]
MGRYIAVAYVIYLGFCYILFNHYYPEVKPEAPPSMGLLPQIAYYASAPRMLYVFGAGLVAQGMVHGAGCIEDQRWPTITPKYTLLIFVICLLFAVAHMRVDASCHTFLHGIGLR